MQESHGQGRKNAAAQQFIGAVPAAQGFIALVSGKETPGRRQWPELFNDDSAIPKHHAPDAIAAVTQNIGANLSAAPERCNKIKNCIRLAGQAHAFISGLTDKIILSG